MYIYREDKTINLLLECGFQVSVFLPFPVTCETSSCITPTKCLAIESLNTFGKSQEKKFRT